MVSGSYVTEPLTEVEPLLTVNVLILIEDNAIFSLNVAVRAVVTGTFVELLDGLVEVTVGAVASLPMYVIIIAPATAVAPLIMSMPDFSPLHIIELLESIPLSLTV